MDHGNTDTVCVGLWECLCTRGSYMTTPDVIPPGSVPALFLFAERMSHAGTEWFKEQCSKSIQR